MPRPGPLAVAVCAFAALSAGIARAAPKPTCVFLGAQRLGCVHPDSAAFPGTRQWSGNAGCGVVAWGNSRWLWLQDNMTFDAAAKRVSPGRWRIIDWFDQPRKTLGYVIWRRRNAWDIDGPKGRRRAVARGPDGVPAGLFTLVLTDCLSKG
jgi:hypothetical protein